MHSDLILWIVVATALAFDFTNGFHDTANAVATSISTRAMPPRVAVTIAAALITAARGESARVETDVAIELAVSWKPLVKSKKRATTTTATSVSSSI